MTGASGGGPSRLDTSDMMAVHGVFREALGVAPRLVGEAPARDVGRAEVVGSYYDNVVRFLEAHHSGEDLLITPLLVERCPGDDVAVVQRVAAQHHDVLGPLHDADQAVSAWRATADPAAAQDAVAALGSLGDVLIAHLDEEEALVLPLAAVHLTPPEWGALPAHGMQSFTGDNIWLILGLIREGMNDAQRQAMLDHMPPPVADAWRNTGEAEFRAVIGEVRSTL